MFDITAAFKNPPDVVMDFRPNVEKIVPIVRYLQITDPFGKSWFLARETQEESFLYLAFDEDSAEFTRAAEAVLENDYKNEKDVRSLVAWNGELEFEKGASISLSFDNFYSLPWTFELSYPNSQQITRRLSGYPGILNLLRLITQKLQPYYLYVGPHYYFDHQVFKDRPGVGWMLYLPKIITAQQVPEARALEPVFNAEKKQIGTIVVSVTDEAFSHENPEHVKIANRIEIRLVDLDLIPRYADLHQAPNQ